MGCAPQCLEPSSSLYWSCSTERDIFQGEIKVPTFVIHQFHLMWNYFHMWEANSFIFSETFLLTIPKNEVSDRLLCNPCMSLLSFEITFSHLHGTYLSSFCSMGVGNMLPCMSLQLGDQPVMVLCTFGLLPEGTWSQSVFPVLECIINPHLQLHTMDLLHLDPIW